MIAGKDIFAAIAMAGTTTNWVIYTRSILRGKTRPHVFSWLIWALLMLTGAAAQYAGGAGTGALPTAYSGLFCTFITVLSLFRGEKHITRSDWIIFICAFSAIPAWVLTRDPLAAALIITLVDAAGFYPTFRKSWAKPEEEYPVTYFIGGTVAVFTLCALERYSLTTALYPLSLVLTHYLLVAMLFLRRAKLK